MSQLPAIVTLSARPSVRSLAERLSRCLAGKRAFAPLRRGVGRAFPDPKDALPLAGVEPIVFGRRENVPEHRLSVRLQIARAALVEAEAHLDCVVQRLAYGEANLSLCGRSDREVVREANASVYAARYAIDEIRLGALDPEVCARLQPNDEDVMGDALVQRAHDNAERLPMLGYEPMTTRCVGVGMAKGRF